MDTIQTKQKRVEQAHTKNRNRNSTFQSDTPARRQIIFIINDIIIKLITNIVIVNVYILYYYYYYYYYFYDKYCYFLNYYYYYKYNYFYKEIDSRLTQFHFRSNSRHPQSPQQTMLSDETALLWAAAESLGTEALSLKKQALRCSFPFISICETE